MPRAGQTAIANDDLPALIAAFERNRAAICEMDPGDWSFQRELEAGAVLQRRILATRAPNAAGIHWKLGELIDFLEGQGEQDHAAALARSARDDLAALAGAAAAMWGVGGAPRAEAPEQPDAPADGAESFTFEGLSIRVIMQDGEPWFVAADACRALGIQNVSQALAPLDADEKGVCSTYTLGGSQSLSTVSESGLYTLILRCRDAVKPGTLPHRFRKWVTAEVLPAIRKRGGYGAPRAEQVPVPTPPQPAPACPLLTAKPYMPRVISLTPEAAAKRAEAAGRKRQRQAEKRARVAASR